MEHYQRETYDVEKKKNQTKMLRKTMSCFQGFVDGDLSKIQYGGSNVSGFQIVDSRIQLPGNPRLMALGYNQQKLPLL